MKPSITSLAKACFRFSSLAVVVGGLFTSAQAQVQSGLHFDYAYSFINGTTVSGSFQGDRTGDTVTGTVDNISDVVLKFNGTPVTAQIFIAKGTGPGAPTEYTAGGVASFDLAKNNFVFADSDLAINNTGYSNFLLSVNSLGRSFQGQSLGSAYLTPFVADHFVVDGNGPAVQGTWSLTTSAIPEPSTYAAIFGALALGAAVYRRRQARA